MLYLLYEILRWGVVTDCHIRSLESTKKWFLKRIDGKARTYPSIQFFQERKVLVEVRQLYWLELLKNVENELKGKLTTHQSRTQLNTETAKTATERSWETLLQNI